ncbi:MAG: hypothetical protein JNK87_17760, partial [Bryobacterales bacterium]|nr:hypothetical protein [Bryobacterales bacterium]
LPYAQLRQEYFAWIDTRVQDRRSTSQMNSESRGAALFVVVNSEDDRRPGVIEPLRARQVAQAPELLAVEVTIHRAMACNWDVSVLLYDRNTRRRVATLRAVADVRTEPYSVLALDAKRQASGELVVGSLWAVSNCTSTWNGQRLRMDRIGSGGSRLLLERDLEAQLQENEKVVVKEGQVRFLYNGAVGDGDILSTEIVANYRVTGDTVTREPPIAMTRAGFLAEWLRKNPEALPGFEKGIEWGVVSECGGSPASWEIEVRSRETAARQFFRIAGERASQLRMAAVNDSKDTACRESETLFFNTLVQPLPE